MSELFDRRVTLTITSGTTSRSWTSGKPGELDLSFTVEKSAGSDPNKASITVWNLNEDSRRLVSDSGVTVRLEAGYVGSEGLIFAGDVDEVSVSREGGDIVTRIECSDGGRALRSTVANVSVARDTSTASVVDDLLEQMGLPRGSVASIPGALKQGLASVGPAKKLLDELVSSAGQRWSVQDGVVQVHEVAGTPETVVVLSKESGMIGVPERMVQHVQQGGIERRGVRVRSLLQPGLNPGRRIRVTSEWLSGDFVVEKVGHSGSTSGGEWYSDVEAY